MNNKHIVIALSYTLLIISFVTILYVRFSNPDLTETRLLLAYWPIWCGVVGVVLVAAVLLRQTERVAEEPPPPLERGVDLRLLADFVPHDPEHPVRCHACEFYGGLYGCTNARRRAEGNYSALRALPYSEKCEFWKRYWEEYRNIGPMDWSEHRRKFERSQNEH